MRPSSTASVSPISQLLRWSFTKRYGCSVPAEADGILARVLGLTGGIALAQFQIVEAPAQDAHGGILVVMLRALVLALDGDARGDVRDAHGGVGAVDVLAAGAGSADPIP
mgnify:CR=1 FL=1